MSTKFVASTVNQKSEIRICNFEKHINGVSCKKGGTFQGLLKQASDNFDGVCKFCGITKPTALSLSIHHLHCANNPNKMPPLSTAGMLGKKHSEETKRLIGLKSKGRVKSETTIQKLKQSNANYWNAETRLKQSNRMKEVVINNPESYSAGNQGRAKVYEIDGVKLKGKWEVKFYLWCKQNDILVERPSQGFEYEWNGTRLYFPDFYLPVYDLYIEVKGYETDRDRAKWKYFPHKLGILRNNEIKQIDNNSFNIESIM